VALAELLTGVTRTDEVAAHPALGVWLTADGDVVE
jgi:hypothetical protein